MPPDLLCVGFFWDSVSWALCPGWLQVIILLVSASQVARIIGLYEPPGPSEASSLNVSTTSQHHHAGDQTSNTQVFRRHLGS
jgi:hypothetical protein